MNLFFLHPRNKDPKDELDNHSLIMVHEPPHDTTEGSEFLDDAIRTEDQPLTYTEINIGAGYLEGLS